MGRLKFILSKAASANGAALVLVYAAALFVAVTFAPAIKGDVGRSAQQAPVIQALLHKG